MSGDPRVPGGGGAISALAAGGKAAAAQALTRIERAVGDPEVARLLDAAHAAQSGVCVALTGPPGVGKSSLLDVMIRTARADALRVAVIAVDPSSHLSRGAVLGDRARLSVDPSDDGVFVRSMAARDRLGGLSDAAYPASVLLRALYDVVFLETVGVGQSETEAAKAADAVAFCAQPSSGDALQYMKAGVLETPHLVLVTKADLGAPAQRAAADAQAALSLGAEAAPPVLLVSAVSAPSDSGIAEALTTALAAARSRATAARRREQVEAWTSQRLQARLGTLGAAAAATSPARGSGPFAAAQEHLADLERRARAALGL